MKIETLRWSGDCLEMIDQRILTAKFECLRYRDAQSVADGIRTMVVRGAPAIGVAAAYGVAFEALALSNESSAGFTQGLALRFDALAQSRPTAVNLFWALDRIKKLWVNIKQLINSEVANQLLQEAHRMLDEDIEINRRMGAFGAELLKDGSRVLTHCNAGALTTAGHGTALGVFRLAVEAGENIS